MEKNNYFNINRVIHLFIRQLRFSANGLLIGFGAVSGIIVFILSLTIIFGHVSMNSNIFLGNIMPSFFIMGYIFTSMVYSELRTPQRGYLFMILPASTLEKLIVPWILSSVLYIIASLFAMFLINILLIGVAILFSGNHVPLFNPLSPAVLKMFAIYLVTQSVFLLGAIYFKRYHFLKTVLSLFVICMIISFYVGITARLIVFHNFQSISFDNNNMPENVQNFFSYTFTPIIKVLFWGFLAPFFLLVSYFRLREKEV